MDIGDKVAIYIRLPNWVGDVCMSLPSLDAIIDTELPVVVCARPWAKDFLSSYKIASFVPMTGNFLENYQQIKEQNQPFRSKLGLLLPDSLSSALSFKLANIKSLGYKDDGRSLLLRWPVNKPKPRPHAVLSWYNLAYTAAINWQLKIPPKIPNNRLSWDASSEHEKEAITTYTQADLKAKQFVLIAPTATGLHKGQIKVWHGFEELTKALLAHNIQVLMAPPKAERELARQTVPSAKLLPELSLGGFAALTKYAALVICNDSGVSHLAAAANARQISLFGVTDPKHTGPWSPTAVKLGQMGSWPSLSTVLAQTLDIIHSKQMHEGK